MENIIRQISDEVYALGLWSEEWNTYINCYLIKSNEGSILIDTTRKELEGELLKLLSSINVGKQDISTVIATHGHQDHIGNINFFDKADKFIHRKDLKMVPENETGVYKVIDGESGSLFDFEWTWLGGHTPGSIVLYHAKSKILFSGDFICFFGFPLPEGGLVSEGEEVRDLWCEFISSGQMSEALKSQGIDPLDVARGFKSLGAFDSEYLCTGHGVVLKKSISSFLDKLAELIAK